MMHKKNVVLLITMLFTYNIKSMERKTREESSVMNNTIHELNNSPASYEFALNFIPCISKTFDRCDKKNNKYDKTYEYSCDILVASIFNVNKAAWIYKELTREYGLNNQIRRLQEDIAHNKTKLNSANSFDRIIIDRRLAEQQECLNSLQCKKKELEDSHQYDSKFLWKDFPHNGDSKDRQLFEKALHHLTDDLSPETAKAEIDRIQIAFSNAQQHPRKFNQ